MSATAHIAPQPESINPHSLQLLVNTVRELSMARDMEKVMEIVRKAARRLTSADGATFVLRSGLGDNEFCYYADEDAISPLWKGSHFPIQTCISGWAMLHRQAEVIEDIYTDPRIPIEAYRKTFVKSLAIVPIRTLNPIGAIGNYWAKKYVPTAEEVSLLQSLADITAVTIENVTMYSQLDYRVKERTAELHEKNQEITASINYARRIQQATLPSMGDIHQHLPDCFVLYKPKDIIAGDFYWFEHRNGLSFIAAADCTGHGVPGAILSVVCSNALYRSVNEFDFTEPGAILDHVRKQVLESFSKGSKKIYDGMDISLCCINTGTREVKWSGANNGLWYIHNGALCKISPHKEPIGITDNPTPFPTHTLHLNKGDVLYLVTDGFADQFGGDKGLKYKRWQLEELMGTTQDKPMERQREILKQVFEAWKGKHEQVDDVTVIGIRL